MADSKHQRAHSHSDEQVKAPNLFERAKDEIEAIMHVDNSTEHHKETHGVRKDIDENTPLDDVRAPNVFERAKEEVEALIQTIHPKKGPPPHEIRDDVRKEETKQEKPNSASEKEVQTPKFMEKAKEKIEKMLHLEKSSPRHHKETHGTSNDIDENTPIDEVKGPNVFERAKEEIEAVLQMIHPKKEHTNSVPSEKSEGGFRATIGKGLEKVCSPRGNERNGR